jgi:hypothetical protein
VHGPKPRSYAFQLNKKVRRLGLKCALSAKANEGRLILVDSLAPPADPHNPFKFKTKVMAVKLQSLLNTQVSLLCCNQYLQLYCCWCWSVLLRLGSLSHWSRHLAGSQTCSSCTVQIPHCALWFWDGPFGCTHTVMITCNQPGVDTESASSQYIRHPKL